MDNVYAISSMLPSLLLHTTKTFSKEKRIQTELNKAMKNNKWSTSILHYLDNLV